MKQVTVIGDSHIPDRANSIPTPFKDSIRTADHVIHTGDFTSPETLERIEELSNQSLTAVTGNMDGSVLGLPANATIQFEGITFVVTHGTGSPSGYIQRVVETVQSIGPPRSIGIAGHTHEVLDSTRDGTRILNPGSVTGAPPADRETMMSIQVEGDTISVTVHVRDEQTR